jgi:hypothetical protein
VQGGYRLPLPRLRDTNRRRHEHLEGQSVADGQVTLDGRSASIAEIRQAFAAHARSNGVVWYYREAILDARLLTSLSTKPDFSDVVLSDGTTKPR